MSQPQTTLPTTAIQRQPIPLLARPIVRLALLLAVVAAAHGFSLTSGLWLDDHIHYQHLQQAGWNFRDLVDASRLDAGADRVRFWGSLKIDLRFFRPVAFGLMKAEYTLVNWHPAGMHVFNLLWHVAVACLVGTLAENVLRDRSAGTLAALLFAAFPDHVLTVYWISCQPELMVTFFLLTATLAYARWAGWFADSLAPLTSPQPSPDHPVSCRRSSLSPCLPVSLPAVPLCLCLLAFTLALGCRENAIILPAILLTGDLLSGGWRRLRRHLPVYLLLAAMAVLYFLLRKATLPAGWPHRPYMVYPSDPDFIQFAGLKVLYYLGGLFLYLPILPGSAATYFAQKTYLLPIGLAWTVLVVATAMLLWRRWILLLGFVWIILFLGPILPVQPYSPHHLYLPAAGSTLLLTAASLGTWRALKRRAPRLTRSEPYASTVTAGLLILVTVAACLVSGWLYVFGTASEDQLVSDVLTKGDALAPGDELFFINQPLVVGWPSLAIETASKGRLHDLKSYTLTLSDEVVLMTQPSTVTPLDHHNLLLQAAPPGWMAGTSGKAFAELSDTQWPFQPGQIVKGPAFDVTVEQVDDPSGGITRLKVTFHEPIDKPGRHIYFGSPYQVAYPLHFRWDGTAIVTGP